MVHRRVLDTLQEPIESSELGSGPQARAENTKPSTPNASHAENGPELSRAMSSAAESDNRSRCLSGLQGAPWGSWACPNRS